ncbi:MAG: HAD family hydrolase [Chrysiogenales bacterium]|nr:MAG: HAD family hydrolase [Chrysiogenales bacterium]
MKYSNVLFDLDGTLTDSKKGILNSVHYALAKFSIVENDTEALVRFIGPPLYDTFRESYGLSDSDAKLAVEYYREYFADTGIYENELYPDMSDILEDLAGRDICMMIATSKPTLFADRIAAHFNIKKYFRLIRGANMDGTMSEKSEIIAFLMESESLAHDGTIMVGDRKHDIIGARKNGIDSAGVGYGYGSHEEMKEAKPTYLFRTVGDLRAFFCDAGPIGPEA